MKKPWRTCEFTRKEIERAGGILREPPNWEAIDDFIAAYQVMDAWRASHAFPLNTIQMTLRRRASAIDNHSEIVQRLKRAPSVVAKLQRYPDMQLSRMQDLGGCRAIVDSVESVYAIRDAYGRSRDRHSLTNEKDYIKEPQASGYRGIHLIYKYSSDRVKSFNGHRIEIQLRTRVQHAWATAVEIAGIFVSKPLKSSIGPTEWLEFFKYVSSAFSLVEGTQCLHAQLSKEEVIGKIMELDGSIDARRKLREFSAAHKSIAQIKRKSHSHFILILDKSAQSTAIEAFDSFNKASDRYSELEQSDLENEANETKDVVLVAADSIESVTAAYPNYFADTKEFLRLLSLVLPD